jgi:hypothetical protein
MDDKVDGSEGNDRRGSFLKKFINHNKDESE